MKALVGAFNQEKALVGAFSVIVQPVVEPMDRFTALVPSLVSPALDDVRAGPPQDAEVAPVHLCRVARPEPAVRRELLRRGLGLVVVPSRHNIHVYHTCLGTLPREHVAAGHQQLPRLARVHTEAVLVRLRHHLAAAVLLPADTGQYSD